MKGLLTTFSTIKDPRVMRTKRHLLIDILALVICAVLSGCDDWNDIELYGKTNIDWLRTFLGLANGIPSHDTINRVFSLIGPVEFQEYFIRWVASIATFSEGRVVPIDGKRLCNAGTDGKKSLVHMVSAWSTENGLVMGQVKTEEKSNEIKAIPALLDLIDTEGAIFTIDAMGCQKAIASKIIEKKGDYVLAVKENQPTLYKELVASFAVLQGLPQAAMASCNMGLGHGRIEKRVCTVITDISGEGTRAAAGWEGLKTLVKIDSERTDKKTGKKQTETRYYISSLASDASHFNTIVRSHWGIEINLHWQLDVVFKEVYSTKQAGKAAENYSTVCRIALNLLKNDKSEKISIKSKRKLCSWNNKYLAKILFSEK